MTCTSFTSFYAFVKFVTTIHTTTCSIFKLYCSIFMQQKFCLYLHGVTLRVFLHTLQTAGDIIHLIIHHKLFHASCLYYVATLLTSFTSYLRYCYHQNIYQSRQSLLFTAKRSPAVIGRELVPSNV